MKKSYYLPPTPSGHVNNSTMVVKVKKVVHTSST